MGRKKEIRQPRYPGFAERFNQSLLKAGIKGSYEDIGKLFGVSGTTIGNWINGDKLPSMDRASFIALKLNISLDWLVNGKEIAPGAIKISHLPHDAQVSIQAAVDAYDKPNTTTG